MKNKSEEDNSNLNNELSVKIIDSYKPHTDVVLSLVYHKKKKTFLSCGYNKKLVVLYDLNDSNNSYEIENTHSDHINRILLLNEDTVISGGSDQRVIGSKYNKVTRKFEIEKVFERNLFHGDIIWMERMDDDRFMTCSRPDSIFFFSYSTKTQYGKMKESVGWVSKLQLSKTFENCFFFSCSYPDKNRIRLLNHQERKRDREFSHHDDSIYAYDSFVNSKKQEILICGGSNEEIHIYNTSIKNEKENFIRTMKYKKLYCLFITQLSTHLSNNDNVDSYFMLLCDGEGGFDPFLLTNNHSQVEKVPKKIIEIEKLRCRNKKEFHSRAIRDIAIVERKKNELRILTASYDGYVKMMEFESSIFLVKDDFSSRDLKERCEFLADFENLLFSSSEKKDILISLKLVNFDQNIYRSFIL